MAIKDKAQIHMDYKIIEDEELMELLEGREELKATVNEYRKLDKTVKDRIESMANEIPFRCGRFVIERKEIAAKSVAYDTEESTTISIRTVRAKE